MTQKRIVQVSSYYPPHLGGQENAVRGLAQQLAQAGHQVDVLTSAVGGGPKGASNEAGVLVHRGRGFVFGHAPIMPGFPLALFRAATPDSIVHLHIGQAFTPEMVWLVSKLRHIKYIAELHIDFVPSGPAGVLLPLYKQLVLKRVLHAAAAVIVLNGKTLAAVRDTYGYTGRAQIMNNGIDEDYFMVTRPSFSALPPATLRLLFVGRLSKQKNIGALLKALTLTPRQVQLDIVGEGEEYESVRGLIANYGLTNVTLCGRLERGRVLECYATYDALIIPSLYEAQPLVLLEAMAARIPIIGTNVIGVAEHIQDAGIIAEPTAQGLADGIDQYYEQYASVPDMVQRGCVLAEQFRWPRTIKQYEALYEEVLGN